MSENQGAPEQGGAGSILVGLVGLAMLIYAVYVLVTV
tara:strand:+ start:370 stop:480 length:111 start_codon:yes stop_codon:yes gene_type:complete